MNRFWILPLAASLLGLTACSEKQSNPTPPAASSAAAALAAPGSGTHVSPQGPFQRGTLDASTSPTAAEQGPAITIRTPARGELVTVPVIDVDLTVVDPDGVVAVQIANGPARQTGPDRWGAQVALVPGMNIIELEAHDSLGNRTTGYVSAMRGQLQPDDQFLAGSMGMCLTQPGLDRVAGLTQQLTNNLQLYDMIKGHNPLIDATGIEASATALTHGALAFQIDGAPAGATLTVTVPTVHLELDVKLVGANLTAVVDTDPGLAVIQATVDRSAWTTGARGKRTLGLEIDSVDVTFQNFQIKVSSSFLDVLLRPFHGMIRRKFEEKLEEMMVDVVDQELAKSLAGFDSPLAVTIPDFVNGGPDRTLDMMFQVDRASGAPGVSMEAVGGFRSTPAQPRPNATRDVLVLGRPTVPPGSGLNNDPFSVKLSADGVNVLCHGLWHAGILKATFDGTQPRLSTDLALSAKMLYPFLPAVRSLAPDPETPIVIEMDMMSAPLVDFGRTPGIPAELSVGEAELRISIDYMDGGPRVELFALRLAAHLQADVQIKGNEVVVSKLTAPRFRVDIIREPVTDLHDQEIEDFLHHVAPDLLQKYMPTIPPIPIPGLPLGLKLTNPSYEVQPGFLILRGSL